MYSKVMYLGVSLAEWAQRLNYEFSPGELYRMMKEGGRLEKLVADKILSKAG